MAKALITKLNICLNSYLQLLFLDLVALFFFDLLHIEYKIMHSTSKVRTHKQETFVFATYFHGLNSNIDDCLPSALLVVKQDSSLKKTPFRSARRHRMYFGDFFALVGYYEGQTAVRLRPWEDNKHVDKLPWDGFWQFVQADFCSSRLGGWSQIILEVKTPWWSWVGVVMRSWDLRPVGCTAKQWELDWFMNNAWEK